MLVCELAGKNAQTFLFFYLLFIFFNCRGNAQLTQLIIKPPLSCLPTQGTASPLPPPPHSPFCDLLYEELSHYFAPRLMKLQPTCTKILLRVFLLLFCWGFFCDAAMKQMKSLCFRLFQGWLHTRGFEGPQFEAYRNRLLIQILLTRLYCS